MKSSKKSAGNIKKFTTPPAPGKSEKKVRNNTTSTLFDGMERHFMQKSNLYLILIVTTAALLSFLCFDVKISTANDDALYIEAGARYAKNFFAKESFYLANAPLYPTLLGIIIKIFGVNLLILKSFSILFFCSGLAILFLGLRNRIPYLILIPSLLLTAINFPFLMYASLTYSECLYLLMIGITFYINYKCFDKIEETSDSIKDQLFPAILLGFTGFLLMITRNIAAIAIIPVLLYLLYRRKFIASGVALVMSIFMYFFYRFIVKIIWQVDQSQYEGQKLIFQKDAYNPALGMETPWGYVIRLVENAQIYISQRFMYVLGFGQEISQNSIGITVISVAIILWALYLMIRNHQNTLLYSTLFFCCLLGASFIALQTSWGQTRFIMIYLPLILMSLFYIVYYYGTKLVFLQYLYPVILFIFFISSFKLTFSKIGERFPVFLENLKGDPTYGYTPDWQNYIKMSKWCAENMPDKTQQIAVRKAPMSFIFSGGKEFYPIYGTPAEDADSLLTPLRQANVNYFMPAELRANPDMYIENQIIGTIHRYMYYIMVKYPNAFEFVHQEGDLEKTQLYKINWNYIDSLKSN